MKLVVCVMGLATAAVQAQPATVQFLSPGDYGSRADINDSGQVAISYRSEHGEEVVARFSDGMGLQQLFARTGGWLSGPRINNSGSVVFSHSENLGAPSTLRYVDGGGLQELVAPSGWSLSALSFNNHGDVLASGAIPGPAMAALYRMGSGWETVPPYGSNYQWDPIALNDDGQMVGTTWPYRAIRYTPASGFLDVGTLGGATGAALGINSRGDVFGFSQAANGIEYDFVYRDGVGMTSLVVMALNAQLYDMNDNGWVVGMFTDAPWRAFIWTQEGGFVELNSLAPGADTRLMVPLAINNVGQVAVFGSVDGVAGVYRVTVNQLPIPACYVNCDGSTVAPVLNVADLTCFLNRFAAGESYANCDGSTVPPVLNVQDFSCFLNAFAQGCL